MRWSRNAVSGIGQAILPVGDGVAPVLVQIERELVASALRLWSILMAGVAEILLYFGAWFQLLMLPAKSGSGISAWILSATGSNRDRGMMLSGKRIAHDAAVHHLVRLRDRRWRSPGSAGPADRCR